MKKLTTASIIHLVLMGLLSICDIIAIITFIICLSSAAPGTEKIGIWVNIVMMLTIMAMIASGVIYSLHNYEKSAANFYKAFLLLNVVVSLLTITIDVFFSKTDILTIFKSVVYGIKALLLLTLALWKDLGENKTWIIYCAIWFLDITVFMLVIIKMAMTSFDVSLMSVLTALISDIVMGIAIRGKYLDKEARGSK